MIRSFKGKFAEAILTNRQIPKGFSQALSKVARRKLVQLNNAAALRDLAVPPGNQLEALKGNLAGKHSIRINDQWRIVFVWTEPAPKTWKSLTTTRHTESTEQRLGMRR